MKVRRHSHKLAKAHADEGLALQVMDARLTLVRAKDEVVRLWAMVQKNPHDQVAERAWLKALGLAAMAQAKADRVDEVVKLSDKLARGGSR